MFHNAMLSVADRLQLMAALRALTFDPDRTAARPLSGNERALLFWQSI